MLGNVGAQFLLEHKGLNNLPVNSYSSNSRDAGEYVLKAEYFLKHGFKETFEDGYRLPGYPLFLSMFYSLDKPRLAARCAQILFSSLNILFAYLALSRILKREFLPGAVLAAVWAPFYFFSALLYAESLSITLVFALIYFLARSLQPGSKHVFFWAVPLILALLVYLKPNHALLLPPVLLFAGLTTGRQKWLTLPGVVAVFTLAVAPWSLFISIQNHKPILFGTTSGINLYLGTGVTPETPNENWGPQERESANQLPSRVAHSLGLRDSALFARMEPQLLTTTRPQQAAYYAETARKIWRQKPLDTTLYALSKILHCFGFSFRGPGDFALVLLFLSSFFFSIYLWTERIYREWSVFFWSLFAVTCLQAFLYLPDQRFKTVIFDPVALLVLALGIASLWQNRIRTNQ